MSAGYSKKRLAEKMGIKTGTRVFIFNAPEHFFSHTLLGLPANVELAATLDGHFDLIQLFAANAETLTANFDRLKQHLTPNGSLWVSWIKISSGLTTNLTESAVRQYGLDNGMVDVKVIAVDSVWSALKFVYRLKDRAPSSGTGQPLPK